MGTFSADLTGNSGMYFDPISGASTGAPFGMADLSLSLEAVPAGGGGGGVGGFVFDPLAGITTDPTVYVTAPDLSTTPASPTIGGAVDLSPTGGTSISSSTLPAETPIGGIGTIDPSTGLPVFSVTTAVGPTQSDLNNLPLINPVTIPSYLPPIDATTGQPTSVSSISVFDPSQLPNVTAPVTPYGGILPPVQPAAPPPPSLLSRIGQAVKGALSGTSGGSTGGAAPPRAPGTTPATQPEPTTASILGTGTLFPWLLIGAIAYLVFRKDGK